MCCFRRGQPYHAVRLLVIVWVVALDGCQATGQGVESLAAQQYVGITAAAHLEARCGGLWVDSEAESRLGRVGDRLVRVIPNLHCTCSFRLLNSDEVNAASLSTGNIYLTRKLYSRLTTDRLLAAALAHELAHVVTKDGLKHSRSSRARLRREMTADAQAVRFLEAAGFDRRAMFDLLTMIEDRQPEGWAQDRIAALAGHPVLSE